LGKEPVQNLPASALQPKVTGSGPETLLNSLILQNPGALELLEYERKNPRSLARLSRTAVRKSLGHGQSENNC